MICRGDIAILVGFYALRRPYWIMAAILDLRQNLRWPRSIFHIVWSKVHGSTDKTLTGKKAVFTWLGPYYIHRPPHRLKL